MDPPAKVDAFDTLCDEFDELMAAVRAGSEDAAWEFVERYGHHIVRAVRRRMAAELRRKFDSQDFVQAVWLSFFKHRSQIVEFDQPQQLVAFLAKMAQNKVINEYRRRKTIKFDVSKEHSLASPAIGEDATHSRDPTPSQIAMARERWKSLVADQPEEYRQMLRLRFLGHTQADIAEVLNIHQRTVRKVLDRLQSRFQRFDGRDP